MIKNKIRIFDMKLKILQKNKIKIEILERLRLLFFYNSIISNQA